MAVKSDLSIAFVGSLYKPLQLAVVPSQEFRSRYQSAGGSVNKAHGDFGALCTIMSK